MAFWAIMVSEIVAEKAPPFSVRHFATNNVCGGVDVESIGK